MDVLDGGVGPHDGRTDATRPYIDGQYAHRLPPLSTPRPPLDGGNATIRGRGARIPNAGTPDRGSTMRRWAVKVDPGVEHAAVTRAAGPISLERRPNDVARAPEACHRGRSRRVGAGRGRVRRIRNGDLPAGPTPKYANLVLYASPAKAPNFDLGRLGSGARLTSAVLGDGPAVVNWFQSTCVACQAELGTFAAVADTERTRIHFLGVDVNDPSPAAALAMVRRAGAEYPVAEAPGIASIALATRFGVGDLPATVFVSACGNDPG